MSKGAIFLILFGVLVIGTWVWIHFGPRGGYDPDDPIFDD